MYDTWACLGDVCVHGHGLPPLFFWHGATVYEATCKEGYLYMGKAVLNGVGVCMYVQCVYVCTCVCMCVYLQMLVTV